MTFVPVRWATAMVACCLFAAAPAWADTKVAVVDMMKVLHSTVAGKAAQKKFDDLKAKKLGGLEKTEKSLKKREKDSPAFIWPQRTFADMVVSFYPPENNATESGAHLNVRHTLRPTLPHPDLTPLLEGSGKNGLHLELVRLLAAEGEDLAHEPAGALGRAADLADALAHRGGVPRVELGELGVAVDDRDEVVEVVGDATGHPADGLHPLALTHLGFEAPGVRDVGVDEDGAIRRAIAEGSLAVVDAQEST